ncbi:MAG: hypothetical protein ACRD0K_17840 [Egibacteraceae bacterium]
MIIESLAVKVFASDVVVGLAISILFRDDAGGPNALGVLVFAAGIIGICLSLIWGW